MALNKKISARMSSDIVAQLDAYASALQVTRSEAIERLIMSGLENMQRMEYVRNTVIQRLEKLEKQIENGVNRLAALQVKTHKKATLSSLLGLNMIKSFSNITDDQIRALISAAETKAIEDLRNG